MFSNLISAIQGGPSGFEEENEDKKSNNDDKHNNTGFYDVASSLLTSVRKNTDNLITTAKQTNWKSELETFTKTLKDETMGAIKSVEHLPEQASAILPNFSKMTNRQSDHPQNDIPIGTKISDFGKKFVGTSKEIFDQIVNVIESEIASAWTMLPNKNSKITRTSSNSSFNKPTRFEAEVLAMQRDSSTYCDEPEDCIEFQKWKSEFSVEAKEQDIHKLIEENAFMAELQARIVPRLVPYETFWMRYYYRLQKLEALQQQRLQINVEETKKDIDDKSNEVIENPEIIIDKEKTKSDITIFKDDGDQQKVELHESKSVNSLSISSKTSSDYLIVDDIPKIAEEKNIKSNEEKDVKNTKSNVILNGNNDDDIDIDEDWGHF